MWRRSVVVSALTGAVSTTWSVPPTRGTGQELFGSGGGQALADEKGVPLLARIPLDPVMREAADDGAPVAEVAPDSEAAAAIASLAESVAATRAGVIRKPLTVLS